MSEGLKIAALLSVAIIIAAVAIGGRYTVVAWSAGGAYIVDRFTGATSFCLVQQCQEVMIAGKN